MTLHATLGVGSQSCRKIKNVYFKPSRKRTGRHNLKSE